MDYLDFVLEIGLAQGDALAVRARSPAGEGRGSLRLPLTAGELADLTSGDWLAARLREGGGGRVPLPRHVEVLPEPPRPILTPEIAGGKLFGALFAGEVESLFHESLGRLAGGPPQGLRIRLVLDPRDPELARLHGLPWELLYRARTQDFLGLSRATPIVRSLDVQRTVSPPPLAPRLRVLAVASSPQGLPPLRLDLERRNLEVACDRRRVELAFLEQADAGTLRETLLRGGFHVLHFMGHAGFAEDSGEGVLDFEAADRSPQPVSGRALAADLKDVESLRLVVLNACDTARAAVTAGSNPFAGVATALVMGGLPAVVAMQTPISDAAAVAFSRVFYRRLAIGDPVEAAVAEGRLAVHRLSATAVEWAAPVLFLRGRDGMLFERRTPSPWKRRAWLAAGLAAALALALAVKFMPPVPRSAPVDHAAAGQLFQKGDDWKGRRPAAARIAFHFALDRDPKHTGALTGLAELALEERDLATARKYYGQAVAVEPGKAIHHYNLGWLCRREQRPEEAIDELRQAIRLDPGYVRAYSELAALYLDRGLGPEALRTAEDGIARDATFAPLYRSAGCALLLEKQPAAARDRLEKALGLESNVKGRDEIWSCLARAYRDLGNPAKACDQLARLESFESLPKREEDRQMARQLHCAGAGGQVPASGPSPAGGPVRAAIGGLAGEVSIVRQPASGPPEILPVHSAMLVPPEASVVVAAHAWADVVCSTETLVTLVGPVRRQLTAEACRGGNPLPLGSYRRTAPEAGSLSPRWQVYERPARGPEKADPSLPLLLVPRDTWVLEPRPAISWTRVERAVEYEIEKVGTEKKTARLDAAAVACGPSPDFPGGPDVCSAPYPPELPDLAPGEKVALRVNVRKNLAGPMLEGLPPHGVTRLPAERASEARTGLDRIAALPAGEPTRRLLAAGLLADNRLDADALRAYRGVLDAGGSAAVRVTLADLYLRMRLDGYAEAAYRTALTESDGAATRAAAETGLGQVERRRGSFNAAHDHFTQAQALYARAGLGSAAQEAGKAARRAAADAAKSARAGG